MTERESVKEVYLTLDRSVVDQSLHWLLPFCQCLGPMDELAEVATMDKILDLLLELITLVRVVAVVTVEMKKIVFVVGGI